MELLFSPEAWVSLLTLTVLEIVLGIDNIIFISIIVGKLPPPYNERARKLGLALALIFRILLLLSISWLMTLRDPVIAIGEFDLSWKDLILIAGGLFLIVKAVMHLHEEVDEVGETPPTLAAAGFSAAVGQIILIDIVFSLDSIITAVGLVEQVQIMIAAVIIAVGIMFVASGPVAAFINSHPTTKVLALAFLLMVGVALIADGLGFHIPRGYIYVSMAFAGGVEAFNIWVGGKKTKRAAEMERLRGEAKAGLAQD
jgi:predicted tellurium resistance membrane protein TerC